MSVYTNFSLYVPRECSYFHHMHYKQADGKETGMLLSHEMKYTENRSARSLQKFIKNKQIFKYFVNVLILV